MNRVVHTNVVEGIEKNSVTNLKVDKNVLDVRVRIFVEENVIVMVNISNMKLVHSNMIENFSEGVKNVNKSFGVGVFTIKEINFINDLLNSDLKLLNRI